jgi:hypothetical protein
MSWFDEHNEVYPLSYFASVVTMVVAIGVFAAVYYAFLSP